MCSDKNLQIIKILQMQHLNLIGGRELGANEAQLLTSTTVLGLDNF